MVVDTGGVDVGLLVEELVGLLVEELVVEVVGLDTVM